jgi:hypothetical protein
VRYYLIIAIYIMSCIETTVKCVHADLFNCPYFCRVLKVIKVIQAPLVRAEREETEVVLEVQDPSALLDPRDPVENLASPVSMEGKDQRDRQVLQEGVASQEAQAAMDKTELQDFPESMVSLVLPVETEGLAGLDLVVAL